MNTFNLTWIDYSIMLVYIAFVLGIGWALKRYMKSSTAFLEAGRSIPAWITGLAFISANLGALEVIGMAASGAKYGMMTVHFYLDRSHPGDDLPRDIHDAFLLRIEGQVGARIPEAEV